MKARLLMKLILRLNIGLHRIKWSWIGSMLLWRPKFCLLLLFRLPLNPHESLLKSDLHLNHRTVSCNYATSYFVRTVRDDLSIADYLDKLNSVSDNLALASNLLLMVIWFRSSWIMLVQLMRWLWVQPSPVTNRSLMMILEHYSSVLKGIFPVIKSQMIPLLLLFRLFALVILRWVSMPPEDVHGLFFYGRGGPHFGHGGRGSRGMPSHSFGSGRDHDFSASQQSGSTFGLPIGLRSRLQC